MNGLLRDLAPISAKAWGIIDDEALRTLTPMLAGRRIVEFTGPLGWNTSAISLGRDVRLDPVPREGVVAHRREVQPLVEFRAAFTLSRRAIEAIDRGAKDPDLDPVRNAAQNIAMAEDSAIFHGYRTGGIVGIGEAASEDTLTLTDDYERYPDVVAEATARLRMRGVDGPYAIALGPRCFTGLTSTTVSGYPVMEHVRRLLDRPVIWAPAIDGAAVVTLRGGDFEMTVGQDLSVGYLSHSTDAIDLYLQESFTFRVHAPEAAIPLAYATS